MPDPLVSVILPVLNGERFLGAALDSVASQTYAAVEVIVVDDGSSDSSVEIATARPAVRLLRQRRSGVAAARNAGVAAARGELIAFLDQDDEWQPDKLTRQVMVLAEQPDVAIVLSHIEVVLSAGTLRPDWVEPDWLTEPPAGFIPSAWLVRRAAFERVGLLDTSYSIASDSDWLTRAKHAGLATWMLPDALVRWRVHGANQSFDRETMNKELIRVLRQHARRQRERASAT